MLPLPSIAKKSTGILMTQSRSHICVRHLKVHGYIIIFLTSSRIFLTLHFLKFLFSGHTWCRFPTISIYYASPFLTHLLLNKMAAILADDIFKCIFLNENFRISIDMSQKSVLKGPIHNKWALVQVMAWCRTGNKSLPEPMLTQFTDAYMRH